MDINKYQQWVNSNYFAPHTLEYAAIALGGEVGEYQNQIKKILRSLYNVNVNYLKLSHITAIERTELLLELGDILHYIMSNLLVLQSTPEEIVRMNVDKINKRREVNGREVCIFNE